MNTVKLEEETENESERELDYRGKSRGGKRELSTRVCNSRSYQLTIYVCVYVHRYVYIESASASSRDLTSPEPSISTLYVSLRPNTITSNETSAPSTTFH